MRNFLFGVVAAFALMYFYDVYKTKEMVGLYDNTDYELARFKHFAFNMKMCMEFENCLEDKYEIDKYKCKVIGD